MSLIPNSFIDWAYSKRCELLEKIRDNTFKDELELFIGFTRHTPVMITNGSAGLNGSVKGFGFVPKPEFMDQKTQKLMDVIKMGKSASQHDRINTLIEEMYSGEALKTIDFSKLISLELARKHTYENVKEATVPCTLVYYEPPMVSFEVRGNVHLETSGKYVTFANVMHDIYHAESTEIKSIPAYVIEIDKIFDNSVRSFGKEIPTNFDKIGTM